jgi:predicted transcriptional regulator
MSKDIELHIGGDFDEVEKRVIDAWNRAEAGEAVSEDHLTFLQWDTFSKTMTTKRLELLRHLHRHPQASILALSKSLGRDYKRVHEDVEILSLAGLIERDGNGLRAGYDEIRAVIAM